MTLATVAETPLSAGAPLLVLTQIHDDVSEPDGLSQYILRQWMLTLAVEHGHQTIDRKRESTRDSIT